jgi:hypothetical protein
VKKIILFLSLSLLFISCAKAQNFDPQPLKNEIAGLEQTIVKARAESGQYSGGLIKALLDSRIQILENTKAMLEQRLAAGNYGVKISYKVDGKEYIPPANKAEIIKNLESEALQVSQELANAKKEADKYSGGLVQAMALSTVATIQQQLAMLDMKRCALIYDIPLFAFIGGSTNTDMSGKTPVSAAGLPKEAPSEIDSMFDVKLTGKRVFEANYSNHLGFNLLLTNHTEKDIKAVQGVCIFSDLFDQEILRLNLTLEENVPAGQSVKNNDYSMELNQFMAEHNRLRTIEMENLKMRFEAQAIIFKDGSIVKR